MAGLHFFVVVFQRGPENRLIASAPVEVRGFEQARRLAFNLREASAGVLAFSREGGLHQPGEFQDATVIAIYGSVDVTEFDERVLKFDRSLKARVERFYFRLQQTTIDTTLLLAVLPYIFFVLSFSNRLLFISGELFGRYSVPLAHPNQHPYSEAHDDTALFVAYVCVLMLALAVIATSVFRKKLYGDSIFFTAAVMTVSVYGTIIAYAHEYVIYGIREGDKMSHKAIDCIYFSIVTMTTLGYGDFSPSPSVRMIAASEAIYGYFAFALLVASITALLARETRKRLI